MSHATLDRVLAVLVVAMAATGLLSLRAGAADTAWVFTLHAALGGSLLAATVWKLRRSVPRAARSGRWRRLALGLLVSLGVVAALTGGFLWVASGELLTVGTWTVLTLHAWIGLLVVPLVVVHLLPRRWRVLRPLPRNGVSRRTVLAAEDWVWSVSGHSDWRRSLTSCVVAWTVHGFALAPDRGHPARDDVLRRGHAIDRRRCVAAHGHDTGGHAHVDVEALRALSETEIAAVLDCTSGWAIETGSAWRAAGAAARC